MLLPAVLFTAQNALLVVALENLEATLFQLIYQAKTCVTALLMVAMLGRHFSRTKWVCIVVLVCGVITVQLGPGGSKRKDHSEDMLLGVASVAVCACSSAFAGVYMEKVFKDKKATLLSARNVHLSLFSLVACLATILIRLIWSEMGSFSVIPRTPIEPTAAVPTPGALRSFFTGFDAAVWVMVLNQAAGGLLVALVIKHADNIMKTIATALAIIVSGLVSYMLFEITVPSAYLLGGGFLVVAAAVLYGIVE